MPTDAVEIPARLAERLQAQREAEARLGRRLTAGERHLDLWAIDDDLERGKEALTAAIEKEKARYIAAVLDERPATMRVTAEMEDALLDLGDAGRNHARREIRSMGLTVIEPEPQRAFAESRRARARKAPAGFWSARFRLTSLLGGVQGRVERDIVDAVTEVGISPAARSAVQSALERRVPGARAAAAELTSGVFTSGLDEIYSANRDAFPCWHYSAVMDGGTCATCRSLDGRRFETLEELYAVLPGFGPNPLCLGMGRCRCRGVPCAPGIDDTIEEGGPIEWRDRAAIPEGETVRVAPGRFEQGRVEQNLVVYDHVGGVGANHRGVSIFVEDGSGVSDELIAAARERIDGAPALGKELLSEVRFLARANPADPHWAKKYGLPGFESSATGGARAISYWRVEKRKPSRVTKPWDFDHELGHIVGDGGGPHSAAEWGDAMHLDNLAPDGTNTRLISDFPVLARDLESMNLWPSHAKYNRGGDHLLSVSEYGAVHVKEDWADSIAFYLLDRRRGYLVREHKTLRMIRFAEMFPGRAAILDGLFGNS